jgi:hypothetical protein
MGKTAVGWVMTLVIVGTLSAVMMALGVYTPCLSSSNAIAKARNGFHTVGMEAVDLLEATCVNDTLAQSQLLVCFCFYYSLLQSASIPVYYSASHFFFVTGVPVKTVPMNSDQMHACIEYMYRVMHRVGAVVVPFE